MNTKGQNMEVPSKVHAIWDTNRKAKKIHECVIGAVECW
jgi:hypothetical protein